MEHKVYSIPAVAADGSVFSLVVVMSPEQEQAMAAAGDMVLRTAESAEVLAMLDVDASALAVVEAEGERLEGRVSH